MEINPFHRTPPIGSYSLLRSRVAPQVLDGRVLTIHLGEQRLVQYIVLCEPISSKWLAIEKTASIEPGYSYDTFDLLWLGRHFGAQRDADEVVECVLLSHGFVAPWIASRRGALSARMRLDGAWRLWQPQWLDPANFDTYLCSGCDECDGGESTVHRLYRDPDDDGSAGAF